MEHGYRCWKWVSYLITNPKVAQIAPTLLGVCMPEKELKAAIREEVERKKEGILDQAKKEAEDILSEANEQANSIKDSYVRELAERIQQERQRLSSVLALSARRDVLIERAKVFERVTDTVTTELGNVRGNSTQYGEILRALIIESRENFPNDAKLKIKVLTEDLQLCQEIVGELKLNAEIAGGLVSSGGLVMSDMEEKYICYNTLESRLEKIMPQLKQRFHKIWL